ncbi:hypothetical protein QWY31_05735 [Cytophagales bacterium LB-30]|uniref:Uncharacterized protein n=1 Tax=Shiella aurantiaca TaxID=3058365 RepID=A0ABT8F3N7_9BACT|nr:hypothetical protein [Shiella aurantiaca]MDN4164993.1 hypothetical protein [Shiella aurantiaca]
MFDCSKVVGLNKKLPKDKFMLLRVQEGYANLYFVGSRYKADKQGNVETRDTYVSGADLPSFDYYIKKKGNESIEFFSNTSPSPTMFGLNKMLKRQAAALLADDEALLKRIDAGEFKHEDIPEVISIYNANKAKAKK